VEQAKLGMDFGLLYWNFMNSCLVLQHVDRTSGGRWIKHVVAGGFTVHVKNVTEEQGVLGLAGPYARHVMRRLTVEDLSDSAFPFMACRNIMRSGRPDTAVRISYTGMYCSIRIFQLLPPIISQFILLSTCAILLLCLVLA